MICFLRFASCFSGFNDDFLNHYVWNDVDSVVYMSGEAPFIL